MSFTLRSHGNVPVEHSGNANGSYKSAGKHSQRLDGDAGFTAESLEKQRKRFCPGSTFPVGWDSEMTLVFLCESVLSID